HWFKLKHTYGIYFLTLEKSNSAAETCSINLVDHSDPRKAQGRAKSKASKGPSARQPRPVGNFINIAIKRATQRTQRFIRWIRVWIYKKARWSAAIARLGKVWAGTYSSLSAPIHGPPLCHAFVMPLSWAGGGKSFARVLWLRHSSGVAYGYAGTSRVTLQAALWLRDGRSALEG
ncbi:MAG: hypothetical protein MUF13_07285, partial [Akkermansiaceae bacterium]|nr:hypothetical protein [Akkermansiaceae bacterium]